MDVLVTPVLMVAPAMGALLRYVEVPRELLAGACFVALGGLLVGCVAAAQDAVRARQRHYGLQHRLQATRPVHWLERTPSHLPGQFRSSPR